MSGDAVTRRGFLVLAGVAGAVVGGGLPLGASAAATPRRVSGVYPSLAVFNDEGECGIGAVVVWADRLWVITYGPHLVLGSSDKLYEIASDLTATVRPESVGGTNANRMVHAESNQLFIGPYVIDGQRRVRVIPRAAMPGRLTGTARHVSQPRDRVHFATMEEGLYSVDVRTLEVFGHIKDGNGDGPGSISSTLPGYHGKGLYQGQSVLVYSNNGERSDEALTNPRTTSGALAEWSGSGDWTLVRRNQFTEVTGPGGIAGGNARPEDPVWSLGWDHRSVLLMVRHGGRWHTYRLPKASHTYDGAHGWNTEWPRIRDIGETDLLATMHGAFWRFPAGFRPGATGGVRQRSTYAKVVGDFGRWGDQVVLGCDDTARNEFLNTRRHKGGIAGPGQSQSNLWFVEPSTLDRLGVPFGRGAVWDDEPVAAGAVSDPFLVGGFDHRGVHLAHDGDEPLTFTVEVDRDGSGTWVRDHDVVVGPRGYRWAALPAAEWVRLRVDRAGTGVTAAIALADHDARTATPDSAFDGLARVGDTNVTGGLVRARGANLRTLAYAADRPSGPLGYYELGGDAVLRRVENPDSDAWHRANVKIPTGVVTVDAASVVVVDDTGRRRRLPLTDPAYAAAGALGPERLDREVCTERDLFHCHGTFYELPAANAGGFARMRPIATHRLRIKDYCSYRGMLVLTGVRDDAAAGEHVVRSDDGKTALWLGVVDDLWRLGVPRGHGGPWASTPVTAGTPSDPYLMSGYQDKVVELWHDRPVPVDITVEVDVTGEDRWRTYRTFRVPAGQRATHRFPDGFSAYWVRVVAAGDCTATARLTYGPA